LSFSAHAADFDPHAYETEIRRQARIPDEWLACGSARDCVIAKVPCQTGIAVSRQYKASTEGAICQAEDCSQMCNTTLVVKSYTACEDDLCVLRLGTRMPAKLDEDKPEPKKAASKKSNPDDDGDKIDPRDFP
jgi:hypothetical protein